MFVLVFAFSSEAPPEASQPTPPRVQNRKLGANLETLRSGFPSTLFTFFVPTLVEKIGSRSLMTLGLPVRNYGNFGECGT